MALRGCCGLSSKETSGARLRALVALGLPTEGFGEHFHYPFLSACILPKLFLSGDRDEYAPSHDLREAVEEAADPKKLVLIQGADHFFSGQLEIMQNALAGWLKEQVQ
jgi:alpha/beta superfamily hydrolase